MQVYVKINKLFAKYDFSNVMCAAISLLFVLPLVFSIIPVILWVLSFGKFSPFFLGLINGALKITQVVFVAHYLVLFFVFFGPILWAIPSSIYKAFEISRANRKLNKLYPSRVDDVIPGAIFGTINVNTAMNRDGNPFIDSQDLFTNEVVVLDKENNHCLFSSKFRIANKKDNIPFPITEINNRNITTWYSDAKYLYTMKVNDFLQWYKFTGENIYADFV